MFNLFRRKIGLALGSGGAMGFAHIGVIKELEKNNIAIDYISGSSIGSIVGGLYALTKDIKIVEELAYSKGYKDIFNALSDPSLKSSLFKGEKILDILDKYIPQNTLIQDTKIPFATVATSLVDGSIVVFKEGNLRDAIRASISIPLIFKPVKYQKHILVDGGFSDPVPIDVVKEMGAQRTIGVNLYSNMFPKKLDFDKLSFIDVISSMIDISLYNNSMSNMTNANVQLNLAIDPSTQFTAFGKDPTELIKIGEEATRTVMSKLKLL